MARFSHKNARIEFDSVNISGVSNTCTLTIDVGTSEVTCFGEAWDIFVEDIAGWSIAVAGFTDQDAGEVEAAFVDAVGTGLKFVDYRPYDTAGQYKFDGYGFMTSFSVGGAVKGGCPFSVTIQGSGALTRTAL